MAIMRGLVLRYAVRAALLVMVVTTARSSRGADAPAARGPVPPSDTVLVSGQGRYALGAARARAVVEEFGDYQCPFCRRFHERIFPQLKAA